MPLQHDEQGFLIGRRLARAPEVERLDQMVEELRGLRQDLGPVSAGPLARRPAHAPTRATPVAEPQRRDARGRFVAMLSGARVTERQRAEETVTRGRAIGAVTQPLARGYARMAGDADQRARVQWYRRFFGLFQGQHRDEATADKRQQRLLQNIERGLDKKPGESGGMGAWLGALLAPLAGLAGLLGGLPGQLARAVMAGLTPLFARLLAGLGLKSLAGRLVGGGRGAAGAKSTGERARAAAGGKSGADAPADRAGKNNERARAAAGGKPGEGKPGEGKVGGKPAAEAPRPAAGTTPGEGQAAPKGGGTAPNAPTTKAGRGMAALKRAPIIGALLEVGLTAKDVYDSETDPEATRAAKDQTTGRAIGGGAGALGGAWAGGTAGAALGSVVPGIGTTIGGLIGAVTGAYFGGKAGQTVGEQAGGWVSEQREAKTLTGIEDTSDSALKTIERAGDAAVSAWEALKERMNQARGLPAGAPGAGGAGGMGGAPGTPGAGAVAVAGAGTGAAPITSSGTKALLDQIARGEGTTDEKARAHGYASAYDVPLGYGKYGGAAGTTKPLSEMSFAEVKSLQAQILQNSGSLNSSAVGKYQIVGKTLRGLQKELGISDDAKFDAGMQDRLGETLLNRRGYQEFLAGRLTSDQFQKNLVPEWASIADPDTGQALQHTGSTTAQMRAALAAAKNNTTIQGDSAPTVAIDAAALAKDLSAGGTLRKTASADANAGAMSDVPTLSQATEASGLAAQMPEGQARAAHVQSVLESRRAGRHVDVSHLDATMAANLARFIADAEQTFGRTLKVASAYRPPTAQEKAALGSSGSTQAGLGKSPLVASTYASMHGRGEAADLKFADMQSIKDMNALSPADQDRWFALARKHHLNLPMLQGAKGAGTGRQGGPLEWWHVEPGQVAGGKRGDLGLRGDQYAQYIRSRSLDVAALDTAALAKDLSVGGALRKTAAADASAGAVSDVRTLAQTTKPTGPAIPSISSGPAVPQAPTAPSGAGWLGRLLSGMPSPAAQAAGDLLSGGSAMGGGWLGRLAGRLPLPLGGLGGALGGVLGGGVGGAGQLLGRLGLPAGVAGAITEVLPGVTGAADRLLQLPGSLGASLESTLGTAAQSGISTLGGLADKAIQPLTVPLNTLGTAAQSGISTLGGLADKAIQPLSTPINAMQRSLSSIQIPVMPTPNAAPPAASVPLALGASATTGDAPAMDVARDVSDRRIAHIVTGAYSSGGV